MFKFESSDVCHCRVYYIKNNKLYCVQNDSYGNTYNFVFYYCSKDGEPSYPVKFPDKDQFDRLIYPY